MARKSITLAKVEMAEFALGQLLECEDLPAGKRAVLASTKTLVASLRPGNANPADHTPIAYAPGIFGCKCGFRPAKPAGRISTMFGAYHSHLAKIGVPRNDAPVIYGYGPKIGQPF